MSLANKEWIVFILVAALLLATAVGEVFWLVRSGWARAGRAILYVLLTDILSIVLNAVVFFTVGLAMLMLVFGPAGTGAEPGAEPMMWLVLVIALLLPPAILLLAKRGFLTFLKMRWGKVAWVYSLAITVVKFALVIGVPTLFIYLA